jgi:hypothetical protein
MRLLSISLPPIQPTSAPAPGLSDSDSPRTFDSLNWETCCLIPGEPKRSLFGPWSRPRKRRDSGKSWGRQLAWSQGYESGSTLAASIKMAVRNFSKHSTLCLCTTKTRKSAMSTYLADARLAELENGHGRRFGIHKM